MKSTKNKIKSVLLVGVLCFSGLFLNSCQTSEEVLIFDSTESFTKDSKIVSLLVKAVGGEIITTKLFSKSANDDEQCSQFVYPITFYAYEGNEEPSIVFINSNDELITFLTTLTDDENFFISYPVTLLDVDGNETVINDYSDLEGILTMLVDACQGDDGSDDDGSDDDGSDDDGSDDDGSDDDDSDDDDDEVQYEYCGNGKNKNHKVTICHNGQTICISINAIWGHMAHHADDYFGSCNN